MILCTTPIDDEHCEINIYLRFRKDWNFLRTLILAWYVPVHVGRDFHADIPIWEHKVYRERAVLARGDGPINAVRRWARQFYDKQVTKMEDDENGDQESYGKRAIGLCDIDW